MASVASSPVALARTGPFRLGPLLVEPAGCRVVAVDRREERVEPRVMQVLVVLANARGAVVSRDELIDLCWDGRIVSDDAINRVIGRLRRVGEGLGGGAFRIETVPKIGYRLEGEVAPCVPLAETSSRAPSPVDTAPPDRRGSRIRWMWLAAAAAVSAAAVALVAQPWQERGSRLEISRFEGDGLTPTLAADLQSEIAQAVDCDCIRVSTPKAGTTPDARQFRLLGRATKAGAGLLLLPEFYLPDEREPVWRGRIALAADGSERKPALVRLGAVVGCIVGGAHDDQMPLTGEALRHWASFCDGDSGLSQYNDAATVRLERLVAAEPRSALGWEALANQRLEAVSAADPDWRRKALLPAREAVNRAVALAPERRSLLLAQASVTEPAAFAEREALLLKAATDRRDGFAQQDLGHHYRSVGRVQDALRATALSVQLQPWNTSNRSLLYISQRLAGDYFRAAETLATVEDPFERATGKLGLAIYQQDWAEAATLARAGPDGPHARALLPLLVALETADAAAIRAAGAPLAALAMDPATNSASVARMLAIAGRHEEALASIDAAIGPSNYPGPMSELYAPGFAGVRQTAGFWAMAERRGLLGYWREKGPPDFCRQATAPAPCAALVARHG